MGAPQPADEWDFVRPDGDDEDPSADRPAEEEAVHVEADGGSGPEPWRSDESALVDPEDDVAPLASFPDEEPDGPAADGRSDGTPDAHEPDLEEILESQHYAFAPEEPDVEDGGTP
jgi:hypothetical protein